MRIPVTCVLVGAIAFGTAQAATDLGRWFSTATAWNVNSNGRALSRPDFLPGTSMRSMRCRGSGVPLGNGIWQLVKYDRRHQIGLAAATTDQCSVALFKAPAPGVAVADADLSNYRTGRGIHIGSTYREVLSTYGGAPVKHARHFVLAYTATVPDKSAATNKPVKDDEVITLVLDDERVSSIVVSIDLSGLF